MQRIDETPVHKAVREAFVNLIIHADYLLDAGTLKVIKHADGFEFTNPGILKLPVEDIYQGGNSKPRNPRMQTMLRMIGFGDNAGSGFPAILSTWENEGWIKPELKENTRLNQVTLTLKMMPVWVNELQELREKIIKNMDGSPAQICEMAVVLDGSINAISREKYADVDSAVERLTAYMILFHEEQVKKIAETAKNLSNNMPDDETLACMAQDLTDCIKKSAEKSAESAEKSAETANNELNVQKLSKRQKQILACMQQGKSYSTEEIAQRMGLKGPRTRQLLNELVAMNLISCTAATKNRRYIKE